MKMERIFKIKTKTNRIPCSTYPSERRYSASMVIGLSVVFLLFFIYSTLMGTLVVYKMTIQPYPNITTAENSTEAEITVNASEATPIELKILKLYNKVSKDLDFIEEINNKEIDNRLSYMNLPMLMCSGCFLMALGYLLAFGTGVLAWKQWYIDHNITFFFLASSISFVTAAIGLLLSLLSSINLDYDYDAYTYVVNRVSSITFSLALNVTILAIMGVVWSLLAAKIAYVGMKSGYPDDMVFNKGGRLVEVSREQKGSKKCAASAFPHDIIDHLPSGDKLAKYLPKKDDGYLPKLESTLEFQQRVDKFLSEVPENSVKNC